MTFKTALTFWVLVDMPPTSNSMRFVDLSYFRCIRVILRVSELRQVENPSVVRISPPRTGWGASVDMRSTGKRLAIDCKEGIRKSIFLISILWVLPERVWACGRVC